MRTPKPTPLSIPQTALTACRTKLQGSPGAVRHRHNRLLACHEALCAQIELYQTSLNEFAKVHGDYTELHGFVAEHDAEFAATVEAPCVFEVPEIPAIYDPNSPPAQSVDTDTSSAP